MAVPSRIFVGITIFGLISTLVVVPFTVVVLTCQTDEAGILDQVGGSDCTVFSAGLKLFLGLASVLTVAFTVLSWRALLAGARRDAIRRRRAQGERPSPRNAEEPRLPPP